MPDKEELKKVHKYFLTNKDKVKLRRKDHIQGIGNSYLNSELGCLRVLSSKNPKDREKYGRYINKEGKLQLGQGTYGKIKIVEDENGKVFPIKISEQSGKIEILRINLEAEHEISKTADLTQSKLIERVIKEGVYSKFYQIHQTIFEQDLYKKLIENRDLPYDDKPSIKDVVTMSTELLLLTHDLHKGLTYRDRKPRAHRDLKPENIMLDKNGRMCIIDHDTASENLDEKLTRKNLAGSPAYLPYMNDVEYLPPTNPDLLPSFVQSDLFATLRILYMDPDSAYYVKEEDTSVFQDNFHDLPRCLQELLKTSNETASVKSIIDGDITESLVLAAFLYFQKHNSLTENELESLKKDKALQEQMIDEYRIEYQLKCLRQQGVISDDKQVPLDVLPDLCRYSNLLSDEERAVLANLIDPKSPSPTSSDLNKIHMDLLPTVSKILLYQHREEHIQVENPKLEFLKSKKLIKYKQQIPETCIENLYMLSQNLSESDCEILANLINPYVDPPKPNDLNNIDKALHATIKQILVHQNRLAEFIRPFYKNATGGPNIIDIINHIFFPKPYETPKLKEGSKAYITNFLSQFKEEIDSAKDGKAIKEIVEKYEQRPEFSKIKPEGQEAIQLMLDARAKELKEQEILKLVKKLSYFSPKSQQINPTPIENEVSNKPITPSPNSGKGSV